MTTTERGLTFFVWADTHFGYHQQFGNNDLRGSIVEQMNGLPGWPYPKEFGGIVSEPAFVVHGGDVVDGEEQEDPLELDYYLYYSKRLRYPQYEVYGNHDVTGVFTEYFLTRYGNRSYGFDQKGIHFVSLATLYDADEVGHVDSSDLNFLREDLDATGSDRPLILLTHCRVDRLTNGQSVLDMLAGRNVILIVSAHVHKPAAFKLNDIDCIDIGQCRDHPIDPEYGRNFYVIRIQDNRLTALPWRWDMQDWERGWRWANPDQAMKRFFLDKTF